MAPHVYTGACHLARIGSGARSLTWINLACRGAIIVGGSLCTDSESPQITVSRVNESEIHTGLHKGGFSQDACIKLGPL